MNGNVEQFSGDEETSNYCLSDQKQLMRLSECIKQLSDSYVEVCSNQDVGFKILQTAMQSEVLFLSTYCQLCFHILNCVMNSLRLIILSKSFTLKKSTNCSYFWTVKIGV